MPLDNKNSGLAKPSTLKGFIFFSSSFIASPAGHSVEKTFFRLTLSQNDFSPIHFWES